MVSARGSLYVLFQPTISAWDSLLVLSSLTYAMISACVSSYSVYAGCYLLSGVQK